MCGTSTLLHVLLVVNVRHMSNIRATLHHVLLFVAYLAYVLDYIMFSCSCLLFLIPMFDKCATLPTSRFESKFFF